MGGIARDGTYRVSPYKSRPDAGIETDKSTEIGTTRNKRLCILSTIPDVSRYRSLDKSRVIITYHDHAMHITYFINDRDDIE